MHSHAQLVAGSDVDRRGVVHLIVLPPLGPGLDGAVAVDGDTRLQDRRRTLVAIDAHPDGRGGVGALAADVGNGEHASHVVPAPALEDGAAPVGLHVMAGVQARDRLLSRSSERVAGEDAEDEGGNAAHVS